MKTDTQKPVQAWPGHEGEFKALRFQDSRHMKVVELSALRFGCLYVPGNIYGTHFCSKLSLPRDHIAAGRIMSMKNSN